MAVNDKKQPIVVKKIKKGGGGHHGGAWKVAYADFVTAMMAFFLLMWLLGSTSENDREIIADIFQNPSAIQGPGGASTSMIKLGGAMEVPRGEGDPMTTPPAETIPPEDLSELIEEAAQLDELMRKIKEQIENTPSLIDFKDQLKLDITSEGLRIQIVDRENRPMFDLGSAQLKWYTKEILHELAKTISQVSNHISVTGHTDATTFSGGRANYTNWELSADRANAARRELKIGGMKPERFGRVVGLASSVLFDKQNPNAPVNRRISIVVLNRATERAIGLETPEATTAVDETPEDAMGVTAGTPPPAATTIPVMKPVPAAPLPATPLPASEGGDAATDLERELLRALESPSAR
ncbi:MAG: flagellar motor protein MotB [Gammaproteobacteria bacterium]|nr:flagellar motor protein MotB [Gammaproteobacteria bacterium]